MHINPVDKPRYNGAYCAQYPIAERNAHMPLQVARRLCLLALFATAIVGCGDKRLAPSNVPVEEVGPCVTDEDCGDGYICVLGECVPVEDFDCLGNDSARIVVDPTSLDFGEVSLGNSAASVVTITNDSECNLTISDVDMADGTNPGFGCSPCDLTSYPTVVAPQRSLEITVNYSPIGVGGAEGELLIRSDAGNVADDNGIVGIELNASYSGVPALVLDPPELSFGYVPFTAGQGGGTQTHNIKIMNQGTGNAALIVEFIYIRPGTDFSIPEELADISPANPLYIPPYDENDPTTWVEVPVTFAPTTNDDHENTLTVQAHAGDDTGSVVVNAQLSGSSLGPPVIQVNPSELVFKTDNDQPLNLGWTSYRSVMVSNNGQSDLVLDLELDDPTGDFTFSPAFVPAIPAGGSIAFSVLYTPTQSSDAFNPGDPQSSADAWFRIISNDTNHIVSTVDLHGWARSGVADDVLKVEMTFANNASNWAQNDFRNVDMELESPLGYSCKKPYYGESSNGTLQVIEDYCETWSDTGFEGTTTWISGGAFEEPERIILYGLGQELSNGQDYRVKLHYMEDCANVPTGLVADLAGIGVSALLGILGGSIGVPITVPPDAIGDLIAENCWDRASSLVNVTVFVNGVEIASSQRNLQSKGDIVEAAVIRRENGTFSVVGQ